MVAKVRTFLEHEDPRLLSGVLNIMGCIGTGDDAQTDVIQKTYFSDFFQSLLLNNCCKPMVNLLTHLDVQVSRRACWALSNITAGKTTV
jgi:hypothetical protein